MKTTTTKTKTSLLSLTKVLMVGALMSLGFTANAQCAANFTFTVNPANNGMVTFTNSSSGGGSYSYFWSFGDGTGSTAPTSVLHTFASSGTYTVCLTMNDSLGSCYDTICQAVTVINGSSCNASFIPYDSLGYGYFYNTSSGTSLTSTWDFGDGNTGTGTGDITHLYAAPGVYYVCLTVNNGFLGCSDTYCDSILIGGSSSGSCLGIVDATFTTADSSGMTAFYNTPTSGGQVYFWDFGDGSNSSAVGNTTHTYTADGTYTVCLTVYNTSGTADSCQYCSYVTINSGISGACDATFNIAQDSINPLNYFVYTNTTSGSSWSYFWDFGDGTSSTLQYPTHTYADTIAYYLCLTVTNSTPVFGSCTATHCDTIMAGRSSTGITITVVDPAALGVNEMEIATVLENYPNPFSASTTINYAIDKDAAIELSVIDLLGNKVATLEYGNKSAGTYSAVWNAENVAEGMYLLQMKANNQVTTKKIVLNK